MENLPRRFILTSSQNFSLMDLSETLAGRVGIPKLSGLSLREIKGESIAEPFVPSPGYLKIQRKSVLSNDLWEIIHKGSYPALYENPRMDW